MQELFQVLWVCKYLNGKCSKHQDNAQGHHRLRKACNQSGNKKSGGAGDVKQLQVRGAWYLHESIRVGNAECGQNFALALFHRFGLLVRFMIPSGEMQNAVDGQMGIMGAK